MNDPYLNTREMSLKDQFEKEFQINSLTSASIVHYLQTGRVSGSLSVFLSKADEENQAFRDRLKELEDLSNDLITRVDRCRGILQENGGTWNMLDTQKIKEFMLSPNKTELNSAEMPPGQHAKTTETE